MELEKDWKWPLQSHVWIILKVASGDPPAPRLRFSTEGAENSGPTDLPGHGSKGSNRLERRGASCLPVVFRNCDVELI